MIDFAVFCIIIVIFVVFGTYYNNKTKLVTSDFKKFAQEIGLIPRRKRPPVHGGLFATGIASTYKNVFQGSLGNTRAYMFEWNTSFGTANLKSGHNFIVIQTIFDEQLPDFYLCPKTLLGLAPYNIPQIKDISLEGNFSDSFNLYINHREGVDNLTFFTPNVMQALLEKGKDVLLFTSGASLYWLKPHDINHSTYKELNELHQAVTSCLPKIIHNLGNATFAQPFASLTQSPNIAGQSKNIQAYLLYLPIAIFYIITVIVAYNIIK